VEQAELEALYEQFKVLAASEYNDTKFGIHGAISRDTFDKCFIPNTHLRPPAPNLIYDRMFNFYDTKGDGLVDFEEFAVGVSYSNTKSRTPEKLRRVFKGYDLNDDGYVERRDFLRMFKAFYALSKVLVRDIVVSLGDDLYEQGHMEQALNGRQPISAVFTSSIPPPGRSWEKPESATRADEDDESGPVVLQNFKDQRTFKKEQVANLVAGKADGEEQERVVESVRRSAFWSPPLGDEDDLMVPEDERDIGSEVLFQRAMMGINELLDLLFKEKETAAVRAKLDEITVPGMLAELKARLEPDEGSTGEPDGGPVAAADQKDTGRQPEPEADRKLKVREAIAATREEVKERGGEGRLNYDEFARIMTTGAEANQLEFVGAWADLASF
jgi:Ca2+-binding EF-hand superfamily protein